MGQVGVPGRRSEGSRLVPALGSSRSPDLCLGVAPSPDFRLLSRKAAFLMSTGQVM